MSAYSDMNAAKHRTREQLEEYLGRFWGEWQGCRDRLTELASQLEEKQAQSRESFISYADYILRAYGDMRDDSARLRDGMSELTAAEDGIREGMERLLHELDGELPETAAEPEPVEAEAEEEDEPEQGYSIINAVRILERARKRRDAGRAAHESEAARNGADGVSNGGSDGAAKGEYGSAVNGGFRSAARGEFSGTAKVGSENAADGAHAGSSSDMAKNDAEKAAGSSNAERTARNGAAGGEARPTGIFGDVNLRNII